MKKMTILALLLALIATSIKPMAEIKRNILQQIEEIERQEETDWKMFDEKVNPWLQKLDELGDLGKETAKNYREKIELLKQERREQRKKLKEKKLKKYKNEFYIINNKIVQLRDDLKKHLDKFTTAIHSEKMIVVKDIKYVTLDKFIERGEALNLEIGLAQKSKYISSGSTIELYKKLTEAMQYIGSAQLFYAAELLYVANDFLQNAIEELPKKNAKDANYADVVKWIKRAWLLINLAQEKGLDANKLYSEGLRQYAKDALAKKDKYNFKKTADNIRLSLVDLWEIIVEIITDKTKDYEMRLDLIKRSVMWSNKMDTFIYLSQRDGYFTTKKFKSAKLNDHPFEDTYEYVEKMIELEKQVEAEKKQPKSP